MNYIAECLEKFQLLDKRLQNELGSGSSFLVLKKIEEEYSVTLSFALILLVIGELDSADLPEYLQKKYSLDSARAKEIAERIIDEVYMPAFEKIVDLDIAPFIKSQNVNISYQPFDILSIFQGGLLPLLKGPVGELRKFNISVFAALDNDPSLEDRINSAFYANSEIISKENILIEEKEYRPTIGHWIKDFVVVNGSEMFDGLILARYLSTSSNCQRLSLEEKAIVSKILKTYRNLVFFPESMDNIPIELWEVLPVENEFGVNDILSDDLETSENLSSKKQLAKRIKKSQSPASETPTINIQPSEKSEAVEVPAAKQTEVDSSAAKLQAALNDYAPDSLEYKVIKQELERLRQAHISR